MKIYQQQILFSIFITILFLSSCSEVELSRDYEQTGFDYPNTIKGDVIDEYFDTLVADPYRWLEDDTSDETGEWVVAQNKVTQNYLSVIPYREKIRDRIKKLWDYEKVGAPFMEGEYTYFYKNEGLQNQYVLYRTSKEGETEVFLDPNTFSEDGTTSLSSLGFSQDLSLIHI